jgi:hypothetical protein
MVISELFAAQNGLGFTVMQFSRGFQIPEMWSGVFLLGLIGVALAGAYRLVELRLLRWYHGQRETRRAPGGSGKPSPADRTPGGSGKPSPAKEG